MKNTRREFVKKIGQGSAALSIGAGALGFSAKSYSRIQGANMKLNFGVAGVNSRGKAHIKTLLSLENTTVGYICDVDTRAAEIAAKTIEEASGVRPKIYADIRKLLEEKDLDGLTIATPDHWHAPMTILAVKAGKHVYVEKPVAHNLHEAELLIALSKKYKQVVQYGAQGRSGLQNAVGMKDIKDGLIGDVYLAKTWYITKRPGIGIGKKAPVPDWLNWDLFQGPAPREDYRDNVVHYNWHWFETWGTGEVGNNGVHVLDSCRWGLGVCLLGNVSQKTGRTITLSPDGKILNDKDAVILSSRKYEPGWEPKV